MGRTNPTFRDSLRAIEERWSEFRRALRRRDQPRFDQLLAYARRHADASGSLNHRNPLLPILLSIDLEQEGRMDAIEDRIEEHEDRMDAIERRMDAIERRIEAPETGVEPTPNSDPDAGQE